MNIWSPFDSEEKRQRWTFIGTVLAAIFGALWAVFTYFNPPNSDSPRKEVSIPVRPSYSPNFEQQGRDKSDAGELRANADVGNISTSAGSAESGEPGGTGRGGSGGKGGQP